jgi:predicted DNA-binding transcriptional regulator AlpA
MNAKVKASATAGIGSPIAIEPPEDRLLSITEVLHIFPISRSTWYEGVKSGRYPAAVEMSRRRVGWPMGEILDLKRRLMSQRS